MGKHVAVYARVSKETQKIENQYPDLERWLELNAQGEEVVWYKDHYSGTTMDRPGWKKLEMALLEKKVKTILVWKLDRLGRTVLGAAKLFKTLDALKVPIVSLQENFDFSTATGRLMANMVISFAAWESEVRSERVKAGKARARALGKPNGGGRKKGDLQTSPELCKNAIELYKAGWPKARVARVCGFSLATMYRILRTYEMEHEIGEQPEVFRNGRCKEVPASVHSTNGEKSGQSCISE